MKGLGLITMFEVISLLLKFGRMHKFPLDPSLNGIVNCSDSQAEVETGETGRSTLAALIQLTAAAVEA